MVPVVLVLMNANYTLKKDGGAGFQCHDWTVENNELCKQLCHAAGGELNGVKQTKQSPFQFHTGMNPLRISSESSAANTTSQCQRHRS